MHAVGEFKQLVEFFTHHQHGATGVTQRQQSATDLRRCTDIHAPSGLRDDQQFGRSVDFAANDVLLQIAARQRLRQRMGATGLDLVAVDDGLGLGFQGAHVDPPHTVDGVGPGEQQVVRQAQAGHGTPAQAFVRHKVQAQGTPLGGALRTHRLTQQTDAVGGGAGVLTAQGIQQLALAIARHPGDAHNFALAHLQIHR